MAKEEKSRISGKDATYLVMAEAKYPPVHISESDKSTQGSDVTEMAEKLPAPVDDATSTNKQRKAPPRVRKPSPIHNQ